MYQNLSELWNQLGFTLVECTICDTFFAENLSAIS